MILAGDIGGTKTVIGLFGEAGNRLHAIREETFPSQHYNSLEEVLNQFMGPGPAASLSVACFGVAGPVIGGKSNATNLPWELDERSLAEALRVPRVKLLNDLEATAYGMLHLEPTDLCVLQPGSPRKGNIAVIAAGTGLGEAILYWDGKRYHPMATEGGHADFAPRSDIEVDLLRYLQREFGHVSYERLLSGPGLFNIYRFLRDSGIAREPEWLRTRIAEDDAGAVISEIGLAGDDPLCTKALDLFVSMYGSEAGNLTLKAFAIGGVYVGGGIAPKILAGAHDHAPLRSAFTRAFADKGRFADLLRSIEVKVALNLRAPLIGAAHYGLTAAYRRSLPPEGG
ncbi:MAG: glucokinase [Candidatus Methylomirabilis oxygeniifera]|uniref:Glucokinase n=1 Tax=Methylomirabilis oxygeniifera TaxID=671143 RepID=D5MJX7_METO1|nr:MAG: glucokinase [Candidatus Methylomirabilis oxyfera]CBE67560.1 Glucokinase (Glucose kinase) [Candidatus Methylomirabilis oxyfera]